MAVIPSTTGTIRMVISGTFDAAGTAVTQSFDAGADANRFLIASVTWDGVNGHRFNDTAMVYGGVTLTPLGVAVSSSTNSIKRAYYTTDPLAGSNLLTVDPTVGSSSGSGYIIDAYCYSGVNQATPFDGYVTLIGTASAVPYVSTGSVASEVDDLVWVSTGTRSNGVTGGTATGFTERLDAVIDASVDMGMVSGDASGAPLINAIVSWSGLFATVWTFIGVNINAVAAAPRQGNINFSNAGQSRLLVTAGSVNGSRFIITR
jgi:hypothetical protein